MLIPPQREMPSLSALFGRFNELADFNSDNSVSHTTSESVSIRVDDSEDSDDPDAEADL